jgi:hypothetical protein
MCSVARMGMDELQDEMLADGRCYVRLFAVCGLPEVPHHPAHVFLSSYLSATVACMNNSL